jgi:ZIP family zinc transporter
MWQWFIDLGPISQAVLMTCFTWFVTALGASLVFFAKRPDKKIMDGMLGMASGVMIAASFWSLLAPAIAIAEEGPLPAWFPAVVGFLGGGAFLWGIDKLLPHMHPTMHHAEGIQTSWRRTTLLVLAITLHNIPEGLAVGVAFGAVAYNMGSATLGAAVALGVGIGLQNFPEGMAVSMPLRREGFSRKKAFFYGQFSGMVEPMAGFLGAALALSMQAVLPYALAFAAGAMIYVVAEELIPTPHKDLHEQGSDVATIGVMIGFAIMMTLDVALG